MTFDGHICLPPTGRARWWTCEQCGQIWRIENKRWRLTAPEGPAPLASNVQHQPEAAIRDQEPKQ